jgi:hypothetical protein
MDRSGKTVIQPQILEAGDFFDGRAIVVVQAGKGYGSCFIGEGGKIVIRLHRQNGPTAVPGKEC